LMEARRSIDHVLQTAPGNPEFQLHAAQILVAEGDTKGAIEALSTLLKSHATFSARAEAEKLLRSLSSH